VVGAADRGANGAGRGAAELAAAAWLNSVASRRVHCGLHWKISTRDAAILGDMSSGVSVDEFQALEQKVLRAVEIVKREREARAAAEVEAAGLREQLAAETEKARAQIEAAEGRVQTAQREKEAAESQVAALSQEREGVRQRVEKMLQQMDELV